MNNEIQLLQFIICKDFQQKDQNQYTVEGVLSNLYITQFPHYFNQLYVITCWRKDKRFHKEVIEYTTANGKSYKSPPMDIEPVTNNVLFRWHKHLFPTQFAVEEPTILTVRVILDWKVQFESYVLIEKAP